jgi:hypothetical protein
MFALFLLTFWLRIERHPAIPQGPSENPVWGPYYIVPGPAYWGCNV